MVYTSMPTLDLSQQLILIQDLLQIHLTLIVYLQSMQLDLVLLLVLSSATTTGIVTTVPQPPTGLATSVVSSSQINLSWTAPVNNGGSAITGYKIERSTDAGATWGTSICKYCLNLHYIF